MTKRQLVLEDGTVFIGEAFGSKHKVSGEVIFYTGMTGYQEVISDPSYAGKMVVMANPLIGNYGLNRDDFETLVPLINGLIVKEICDQPSNFRSDETVNTFLQAHHIPGIAGIDTRKLIKHIRNNGVIRGFITDMNESVVDIMEQIKTTPIQKNFVQQVSTVKPYIVPGRGPRIVLVDFGVKHGILRELTKRNCHITVIPYNYSYEKIMRLKPDGVLLSNGPGDPNEVIEVVEMIQLLIQTTPVFGIGLGHLLLALACGAKTEKMKYGQFGNYPVKNLIEDRAFMTAKNHLFTVNKQSLNQTELEMTEVGLQLKTVDGLRHKKYPAFSVQYNPESSPGPEDTNHLFEQFLFEINQFQHKREAEIDAEK